ncbi:hypothetical protein, partial [Mesorhizobium carmichaelinearum]|uniref:hypothetical protein n=1 Tax=Mesorhizobium carmichaelinearum TaxID=1208188 RepID=UPI001AECE754
TDFIPTPSARHDELMVANQSIRGVKIGRRFPSLWGQFCTPIHSILVSRAFLKFRDPADFLGDSRERDCPIRIL